MAPNTNDKDVLYIDVDDDITTIIDKVRSSEGKVVALVLPKRATVFQSIVNMKLLKRSAESAKKHAVLVTTEPSIMPLAASVGLYVADTAQSKPAVPITTNIPLSNNNAAEETATLAEEEPEGLTADNAGNRPVGDLAGAPGAIPPPPEGIETLTLPEEESAAEQADEPKKEKSKKNKSLKVPSFNKFRMWLVLGIVLILLIIGLILALILLPKATIAINTNTSNENVSLTATLSPSAQTVNTNTDTVPALTEQQQQTTSQQETTTGQQNNGTAATGSIQMTAEECAPNIFQPSDVPSGSGVSTNGKTYITQGDTTFPINGSGHGSCETYTATSTTNITAQSPGTAYNTSGTTTFTVAGRSDVTASGSASGGTDNIVQVVAQTDIDTAKQKLASASTTSIKNTLEQQLKQAGYYALPVTFNNGTPNITSSSNVGDQASTVTVTQAVTYTMYGVKRSYLDALIASNVDSQINTTNQEILDDGLSGADIGIVSSAAGNEQISIATTAVIGPDINITSIKKQVEGKKTGYILGLINQIPGVTSVDVHLSPFWVSSVPTNPDKVTITIDKAK